MRSRRRLAAISAGCLLAGAGLLALIWTGLDPPAVHGPAIESRTPLPEERVYSLLAVGDTGDILPLRPFGEGQRSVGRGMAAEDRRAPVDAVLLLGDNFYPDGLRRFELVERIRHNLVLPFCHFASADGPRWPEVADACGVPEEERHPVPILAIPGNHDYDSEESPELQRKTVREFLANWDMDFVLAEGTELAPDLSLVRVDSEDVKIRRIGTPIRRALDGSRGRFRLLATHEPLSLRPGERPRAGSYKGLVRGAIAHALRPPQLVLAGHDHNLQVVPLDPGRPALQLIVGGGSSRRPLKEPPYADLAFGMPTTGFARIDLLGRGEAQGLLISIFSMPRYPVHFWRAPRLVSRWWLRADGVAERRYPSLR